MLTKSNSNKSFRLYSSKTFPPFFTVAYFRRLTESQREIIYTLTAVSPLVLEAFDLVLLNAAQRAARVNQGGRITIF